MILSGILLTPTGLPYSNSLVRITANNTSPDVLMFVTKDFKTDEEGAYEIDVPNGWYKVSVFVNDYHAFTSIGNIEITDDTTETTINALLMIGQTAGSDPLVAQVAADAASALASKNAAAISATQAATSATNASNSATASANSATASQTSATNSASSASSSASSASASQDSAVSSASSASTATTQATASAASAQDSLDSANDAQASADLAASLLVTKLDVTKFSEIRGLSSVAALRLVDTTKYTRASTLRYDVSGEGGYGDYYFIPSVSLPSDNGITVILSSDGLGYWVLKHNGVIDVQQAGVKAGVDASTILTTLNTVLNSTAVNKVVFSAISGGQYVLNNQVLFTRSNITYELFADIVNTSTVYRTPLVFAHDIAAQPTAPITNVTLIGNGHKYDGNGVAILAGMGLAAGVLPSTFPAPMFNYIDNLKIRDVDFTNGVYDSCNMRQCRNHKLSDCIFRDATQYLANGLNITTNWSTYIRGDYRTYSYGTVEDCVAYNNASMGMTYYHCSGGTFRRCTAHNNGFNNGSGGSGSGFSYESPTGAFSIKYADGRFENCHANNNGINGYYINTPGVTIDSDCTSMGNGVLGLANDVSGLQMCGVCVSAADQVTVLGIHTFNARHGVTFLGATGLQPTWNCGGEYSDNAGCGIAIQSIYRGGVLPGTKLFRNGRVLIGGQNLPALSVSNSAYLNMQGSFTAKGMEFESNGARDVNIASIRTVEFTGSKTYNPNDVRGTTGGTGMNFGAITTLLLSDNFLDVVVNGWTTNGYVINNDVSVVYQKSNKSNQVTGTVMINNASTKFGISSAVRMTTSTHATLTALPATGTATLANVADSLATLIESLKDGVMQG